MERLTILNAEKEAERIIEEAKLKADEILSQSSLLKAIEEKAQQIKKDILQSSDALFSKYRQTKYIHADFYAVKRFDSRYFALFKSSGEQITDFKYDDIEQAAGLNNNEFMVTVYKNNRLLVGVIDSKGKEFIPPIYENFFNWFCSDGLAVVEINGKYGYINRKNETIIPFIYDNASMFCVNKAEVQLNGRTFFIDKKGNEISDI